MKLKTIKIGILGSGFGAIHTALHLSNLRKKLPKYIRLHVTLISNTDYFWLVTMAHEIAVGNLMPTAVTQPLRSMSVKVFDDYVQANITEIDLDQKQVRYVLMDRVEKNLPAHQIKQFDYIVSALGSETSFFGVDGADKYAFPLKTMNDVKTIKNQVLQCFEDAEQMSGDVAEIKRLLTFVVVGAGPTGIEIAAELADLINTSLTKRFPRVIKYAEVKLINGGDQICFPGQEWLSDRLTKILIEKNRLEVICGNYVTRVSSTGVQIGDDFIPSKTVIWSGGVQANSVKIIAKDNQLINREKGGRIAVESDLSLENFRNVFVIGDQAHCLDHHGNPYPMRAQFAVKQGDLVAKNIFNDLSKKRRQSFRYQDKGIIISLGDGQAVAEIFGIRFSGWLAHFLYRFAYIPQLVGLRAKVKTLIDWTLTFLTGRDLSKL